MTDAVELHRVTTNGIQLNVACAGPKEGPLLLLLHGFPEFWYAWHRHIPEFAAQGFRVMAPDQRGYNLSDRPGVYTAGELVADIRGLIASTGRSKALVVGHDWGGMVAWNLARNHPDLVEKLVILNAPHPSVMNKRMFSDYRQLLKSWYIFFFQLPWLPELALSARNHAQLRRVMRETSRPGTFTDQNLEQYEEAWKRPGALHAMLGWYRAGFGQAKSGRSQLPSEIQPPTLVLWGDQDQALSHEMAHESARKCRKAEVRIVENGTHWIHHEEPLWVRNEILRFLSH